MWYPLLVEGTPFGRYRLLDLLGAGAMGEVHRAYDTGTDRLVAVKVLAREFAHDAVYRKRFQREAQVAARLAEPHIVPIHDFGEIDGRLFLDMRLVQAPNLAELLAERDRLEVGEAVEVIAQIAAALDAAHAEGLVHRDVKPSNILVTPKGFAYLIDFGIARSDEDTTVTTTGAVIGTFAYMAPERLADDESDTRSDVYSLACVLYECLVGAKPYRGESMQRQIAAHLNDEPPLPSNSGVPRPFDAVIAKGMAKYPRDRYETAGELAAAARAALWEPPTEESPVPATAARASDPATPDSETRDPHTSPPRTPVSPAEPTPVPAANPAPTTTPDPTPITTPDPTPIAFSDPTPVAAPESGPVAAPTPRPPWRAIIVMSVLALAVAGTSALALTRDNSTLVTETPEKAPPALSSTIRRPAPSTPGPVPPGPPPALAPPVSVTESVPVTPVAPGGPVADPPPVWTEPEPQPSAPPPPPVTTTPPPPVTTTTAEPTESETTPPETTTPVTTTPETTTPATTVTTTEEGEEVAEDGSADATGSTIATSSPVGPTDGTTISPSGGSATDTTAPSSTGTAVDTTAPSSTTGVTEGTTPPTNGTDRGPAPASSTDRITATPSTAADPG